MDADQIIKEYVDHHEAYIKGNIKWQKGQTTFDDALNYIKSTELETISEQDVIKSIKPFLIDWGTMSRVINQKDHSDWPRAVARIIRSNHDVLTKFQQFDLVNTKITSHEKEIKHLYELLSLKIHPVAATKTMHLLCPSFFPIWDNAISDGVRNEISNKYPNIDCARLSSDDYFRYMLGIQEFLVMHDKTINLLAKKYQKGQLRILDECFWWGVRRPFCLLF